MSLLPARASYFEEVEACFLAFRGDGVALSAQDVGLIFEWHARQIPSEVICHGIRSAAERAIQDARVTARPRSLRACRREIEREIARYLALSAGRPSPAIPAQERQDTAPAAMGRGASNDQQRVPAAALPGQPESDQAYLYERLARARQAIEHLMAAQRLPAPHLAALSALLDMPEGSENADVLSEALAARLTRFDESLSIFSLRAQPFAVRRAVIRRARQSAGMRPRLASPLARRQALRHHLLAEIRSLALVSAGAG